MDDERREEHFAGPLPDGVRAYLVRVGGRNPIDWTP
jgi:hypothetical protein